MSNCGGCSSVIEIEIEIGKVEKFLGIEIERFQLLTSGGGPPHQSTGDFIDGRELLFVCPKRSPSEIKFRCWVAVDENVNFEAKDGRLGIVPSNVIVLQLVLRQFPSSFLVDQ